jgi:hypothetical protein
VAKYGSFKYGAEFYGDGSINTVENLLWAVQIDWDGDGVFDGTNEAGRLVGLRIERGRDNYLSFSGVGFERYSAGRATIHLDNDDERFNAFNTSSPLYQQILPGRFVRIGVRDVANDTYHELIRGKIEDIQPFLAGNRQLVRIEVVDGQRFLEGRNIRLSYKRDAQNPANSGVEFMWTYGRWADRILSAEGANWPDDEWPRTYDVTEDYQGWDNPGSTENFYGWLEHGWFWDRDALQAMRELEEAELGTFLHARNGEARFLSSHFTYDNLVEIYEDEVLRDITTPQPWEIVRNQISVDVNQVFSYSTSPVTVWQAGGTDNNAILVEAGSSIALDAKFNAQFSSLVYGDGIVPYNTNWVITANTAADGTGTNISSDFYATFVGGTGYYGDGGAVIVFNNNASNGYITDIQLNGYFRYRPKTLSISDKDATSQSVYGNRILKLDTPWVQQTSYAQTITSFLVSKLKDPEPLPTIKIQNRPDKQFGLDLYVDAVNFVSDKLGIDNIYRIGKITHEWLNETGQHVLTTLKLEPYFAIDAPTTIDTYDLLSRFVSTTEADCSGAAAAGQMEWCRTGGLWGQFTVNGRVHEDGTQSGYIWTSMTDNTQRIVETTGLSYVIKVDGVLRYWYNYAVFPDETPGEACYIEVTTAESGVIVTEWVPFVLVQGWNEAVIDLSAWLGETVTKIKFEKVSTFASTKALANIFITDVSLGRLINV